MLLEFWHYFCLGSKNRYDHRLRFILLWQFHRAMESLVRVHSNRLVSHKYACIYTCKYIYIHTMVYIYIIYIHNNNNNTYIFDCVYIYIYVCVIYILSMSRRSVQKKICVSRCCQSNCRLSSVTTSVDPGDLGVWSWVNGGLMVVFHGV